MMHYESEHETLQVRGKERTEVNVTKSQEAEKSESIRKRKMTIKRGELVV